MHRIHLEPSKERKKGGRDEPIWTAEALAYLICSGIELNMDIINSERYFVELWNLWDEIKEIDSGESYAIAVKTIRGLFL